MPYNLNFVTGLEYHVQSFTKIKINDIVISVVIFGHAQVFRVNQKLAV